MSMLRVYRPGLCSSMVSYEGHDAVPRPGAMIEMRGGRGGTELEVKPRVLSYFTQLPGVAVLYGFKR